MNVIKKLFYVSEFIITGATNSVFEKTTDTSTPTDYLSLSGAALTSFGDIDPEQLTPVIVKDAKSISRFVLQAGDVVLMSRGTSIRAGFVTTEVANRNVIATANFIVIRPDTTHIKGEVLATFLNSDIGQGKLQKMSAGSAVQSIPASKIKELELPIPPINTQEMVAELFHASIAAYKATLQLAEQQKRTADAYMIHLIQGE